MLDIGGNRGAVIGIALFPALARSLRKIADFSALGTKWDIEKTLIQSLIMPIRSKF